jgi:hypothetical protein
LLLPLALGAGFVLVLAVLLWLRGRVDYVIGRASLRITLFGLTLRRIPFADIRRVGTPKRDSNWLKTESWANSWDISHRGLVVHRLSGLRRRLLLTPAHRYTFRHELRQAIAKATGTQLATEPGEDSDE